ncbi:NAD(P)-binding protein [Exidia glandulosa HHB12029]|uniref:NAD(P)-binding protein n=1 Tax=Exidia glandulosa HHB12029 TaxID=1314781 RepID=A0A165IX94_EXIGL|nr:NAD(P)-binding protein [Exidia glandulosa HHB12029]
MTISSDVSAPLVVVVGATGVQGGSVIRNLIESDKPYRLRGLTRDASQPAAQKIKDLGVEVVTVNIVVGNEAEVRDAFKGGDIIFSMTKFKEHLDTEREVAEGKLMVDAAKAVGAKLFIFSGLPPVSKLSGGKYTRVARFDGKAEVAEYARSQLPAVDVQAGYYMTNLQSTLNFTSPKKQDDGTYLWHILGDSGSTLPYIDMDADYGLFVRFAIESPEYSKGGGTIYSYGERVTTPQAAASLEKLRGITIKLVTVSPDEHRANLEKSELPHIVKNILGDLTYMAEYGYYFGLELGEEQQRVRSQLARKPRTFEEFLRANPDFLAA